MCVFIFLSFLLYIKYTGDNCLYNLFFGLQKVDLRLGLEGKKKCSSKVDTMMYALEAHHSGTKLCKVGTYFVVVLILFYCLKV